MAHAPDYLVCSYSLTHFSSVFLAPQPVMLSTAPWTAPNFYSFFLLVCFFTIRDCARLYSISGPVGPYQ